MNKSQYYDLPRPAHLNPGALGETFASLLRLPGAILDTLLFWQERAAQRRRLNTLDDRLLKDIGVSRAEAEHEAAIPFWRVS